VLTVAYCRVSTEEQAAEGFSIEGQGDKLRAYAELHDLGPVTVIQDPGASGRSLDRPGLQQVLGMISRGHVAHLLVWRLDRLSRNLGDLLLLADTLGKAGVGLHSFTERLDLSSATGRMFYNVLGSFAQFYREQLAENVGMGMARAAREGKWTNRPKTGYDLVDGELVPNDQADTVRRIFELRASGCSYSRIEELTGVRYSTVHGILDSRIYLGEVLFRGEWFCGHHEPIVSAELFARAHRGWVQGKKRLSRHPLSGVVRCGLCGRAPAQLAGLRERRRKLLNLHYAGKITADLFTEEEAALTAQIQALQATPQPQATEPRPTLEAFEDIVRHLGDLDIEEIWQEATDDERRILAADLLDEVRFYPDHLEVRVTGAPRMNVTLQEVGLTGGSASYGVGDPTRTPAQELPSSCWPDVQ
jgi:DNA invertase Pin-like site-specific DNA recombinase